MYASTSDRFQAPFWREGRLDNASGTEPAHLIEMMDSDHAALTFAARQPAALCTLVGIEGSFSRRRGAQFAVGRDGAGAGDLADNCLHRELATQAAAAVRERTVKLLRFGRGSPFIDFRLPCGSGLDILIDPSPDRTRLARCMGDLAAREMAELPLPVPHGAANDLLRARTYMPSLRLLVLGTGAECEALQRQASAASIEVEWRLAGRDLSLNRVPSDISVDAWTAIVLLFHDHEWEQTLLEWALETPAFYIGCQGGAPARASRIERLRAAGHEQAALSRIRSPIGLIPHARSPEVLALSVLADVVGGYEELHPHRWQGADSTQLASGNAG